MSSNNKMVKIGILTFHRSINYGAFVQCFALTQKLKEDLPNSKIEVIDYVSKTIFERYKPTLFSFVCGPKGKRNSISESLKRCIKLIVRPKVFQFKKRLYQSFQKSLSFIPLSEKKVVSDEIKDFTKAYRNQYDIIVVGSDGVWEFISYPFPNVYYMKDKIGSICLSYAASSDRMHINMVNQEQKEYINNSLIEFDYLGVRDVATENFLSGIMDSPEIYHNCDPTALIDLDKLHPYKKSARRKMEMKGINFQRPIIGIMAGDAVMRFVKRSFSSEYQIVSLYNYLPGADANMDDLSPLEWATVFSFFSITFTRYYHGTWLSSINLTPTIIIDDWNQVDEKHDTKLLDLAKRLRIKNNYFRVEELLSTDCSKKIVEVARLNLSNPDKKGLKEAIAREKGYYCGFYNYIKDICLQLNDAI